MEIIKYILPYSKREIRIKQCDSIENGLVFHIYFHNNGNIVSGCAGVKSLSDMVKTPEDPYAGASMEQFISLVERGKVTVDVAGIYETHSAMIYKNGERYLLAEKFPVDIEVIEGDVLEIWVFEENPGASVIIKDTSENVRLKYSRTSLPLEKGLHRIGKVIYATDRKK
jgi:hypothetical protein